MTKQNRNSSALATFLESKGIRIEYPESLYEDAVLHRPPGMTEADLREIVEEAAMVWLGRKEKQ